MRIRSHPKHKKLKISLTFLTVALTFLSITKTPAIAMNYGNTIIVSTTADGYQPGTLRAANLAANAAHKRIVILLQPGKTLRLDDPRRTRKPSPLVATSTFTATSSSADIADWQSSTREAWATVLSTFTKAEDCYYPTFVLLERKRRQGRSWSSSGDPGGALYNEGTLSLANCIIVGNTSGSGGYAEGNAGQPSGGDGGGIYNIGTLVMSHTIVSSNACGGFSHLMWRRPVEFRHRLFGLLLRRSEFLRRIANNSRCWTQE